MDLPVLYDAPYSDRLVAFVDLLGFSDIVRSLDGSRGSINYMAEILNELQAELLGIRYTPKDRDRQVVMFSDTIVISEAPPTILGEAFAFCLDVGHLWHRLVEHGVLSRGAITIGRLVHRGHVIFGQGLIDAYRLQTTLASYPRVVFSKRFIDEFGSCPVPDPFIRVDWDGTPHLHVFTTSLALAVLWFHKENYKLWIEDQLRSREADSRVLQKYAWLASYFNESLLAYATRVQKGLPDPVVEPIDVGDDDGADGLPMVARRVGLRKMRDLE